MRSSFVVCSILTLAALGCSDTSGSSSSSSSTGGSTTSSTSAGGAGGATASVSSAGGSSSGGGGANAGGADVGGSGGQGGGAAEMVVIEIDTNLGEMAIALDPVRMPITTSNFLAYVDDGFFSETIIHRVIPDFVIQGGGFTSGLESKNASYDPIVLETHPELLHDYGAISMARTSNPNSATSQFFLINAAAGAHHLDGDYAAFGYLIEGSEVLDAISAVETETVGPYEDVPVEDVVVNSITRR